MSTSVANRGPEAAGPAGYSGTPLPRKLGIKEQTVLAILSEPREFRAQLGALPGSVKVTTRMSKSTTLVIWFVDRQSTLSSRLPRIASTLIQGSLWVAWPKKASGVPTDLNEDIIRRAGLASGLVDYKVCAIDNTWSGLLFTRRKSR